MRYFRNIENGEVYTLDELLGNFADFMRDDASLREMSFYQWLNDCTSKNGSLVEIGEPISAEIADEIRAASLEFYNAFSRLYKSFSAVSEDSFNEYLAHAYPFSYSLDEMPSVIDDWTNLVGTYANCLSAD